MTHYTRCSCRDHGGDHTRCNNSTCICGMLVGWDAPTPTRVDPVDRAARAMIAALEARVAELVARVGALEGATPCICGHTRAQHYAGEPHICTEALVSGVSCGCMAFDPLDFVNLKARLDALETAARASGGGGTIQATIEQVIRLPQPEICECGHSFHDGACSVIVGFGAEPSLCGCETWRPVRRVTA